MTIQDNINDFNENVNGSDNPRLVGYVPVEFFRIVDTDHPSSRIRDIAIPIEQFYDFNLETDCNCDCDHND